MEFKGNGIGSKIYLIDYFEENSDVQYPFNGERGSLVFSKLGSFALLDSVRFANMTMMGEDKVINDIIATDPQVIITFSDEINKNLLYTTRQVIDIQGDVYDIKLNGKSFKLIPLVSPSFILEHQDDKNLLDRFTDGFKKAKEIINGTYVDILSQKEILYAWNYDEFVDLYESKLKGSKLIAYDIETNARPPMYKGSEIIGFSLANKHTGIYTCMSALDNEMSDEDKQKIWNYVKENIFENDDIKLIIHNTMYERPYTLYCVGYEIPFDKAEDTLVMSRLSKGSKESGGLKYQAQSNLGYPDWETDLNIYIDIITFFIERVGIGPKKYTAIFDDLKKISFIQEISLSDIFKTGAFNKLHQEDRDEITGQYDRLKSLLLDNYTKEETEDLLKLIYKKVIETVKNGGIQDSIIPYNWLPIRILSKYGAVDTLATYDLYDYYMKEFDEQSTNKIDLHKGYQNWLEHIYCAYILERNGMYWDDETAQKDRDFLNEQAFRTLKEMMLSPCFEWKITEYGNKYKALILSDYLPEIAEAQGYNVQYDRVLNNYVVIQNNKKVAKGKLNEIKIPDYYKNDYDEIVKDLFYEEIDKAKNFEELKEIYNPSSNIETDIPRKILLNEETDKGHILLQLYELANSAEFKEKVSTLPQEEQKLLQLACYCSKTYLQDNDCIQLNDSRKQFYETFWKLFEQYYNSDYKKIKTKEIKDIFKKSSHLDVEHFDDGGIIAIYDSLCMTNGIDIDDENTWTDQFRWLIDFRLFKKSAKIMTSYIDGSIGRESVTIVDKKSLQNGDKCVERKRNYLDNVTDLSVPSMIEPNEDYLLAARWSPNTAETGRWRSGFHTIPWGSQVKKYYGSRFKGGTTFHPDYSQMEVRSLSAISKDKNMLELFASGKDFHTETAKKIYKKDEVTAAERRFSKQACVLGTTRVALLNGETPMIKDILSNNIENQWVYSYDVENHRYVPGKIINCRETKRVTEYAIVTFDDDTKLECTVDHKLLCRDGLYRSVNNLKVGDSIMPFNTYVTTPEKKKEGMIGYEVLIQDGEEEFTHRLFDEECMIDTEASNLNQHHHINYNKLDNRPSNILLTSQENHLAIHQSPEFHKYAWEHGLEEWRKNKVKGLVNWTDERRKKQAERMKKLCDNGINYYSNTCKILHYIKSLLVVDKLDQYNEYRPNQLYIRFEDLEDYFHTSIDDIVQSAWKYPGEPFELHKLDTSKASEQGKAQMERLWNDPEYHKRKSKQQSDLMSNQNNNPEFQRLARYGKLMRALRKCWIYNNQKDFEYKDLYNLLEKSNSKNYYISEKDFIKFYGEDYLNKWNQILDECKSYNHEIKNIEFVHSDEPIPVYAPSVEKYENFCIVTKMNGKDKSGIVSGQTFALLYGSSEQSFARSYCNGDKDYAHMIFQGFFEAYPDVEKWVNERHEEVMKDNRVSLELSNRFIKIEPENDSPQEIAAIKRKAQNYPIQGQSADLTGCVMFRVQQYLEEHNMKSMLFQYVHDSIEIDVHPDEMIQLCVELEPLLLKLPMDLFGLPSKTEMALGKSLGDELEVEGVEANDDYTECTMTLKGYKDEIYDTVDNWKSYYPLVEILEEDYEEQFVSMADLFIMKKAYTPNLGTTRYNGKCKVHIVNKK